MAPDLKKEFLEIKSLVGPLEERIHRLSWALAQEQGEEAEQQEDELEFQEYVDSLDALEEAIEQIQSLTGD